MSAADTALRVLTWARDGGAGPPPHGDLSHVADLTTPPPQLLTVLAQLAAVTAARLRLDRRPFGDDSPVGLSAVLLAAAIGARADIAAVTVLTAVPTARRGRDLVTHHGLSAAVLAADPDTVGDTAPGLLDDLRDRSPLTGILDHPRVGQWATCQRLLATVVLTRPDGARMFALAFAEPARTPAQSAWRGTVLEALRSQPMFIPHTLDTYESARRFHAPAHDAAITSARLSLRELHHGRRELRRRFGDVLPPSAEQLAQARPAAEFWRALTALVRTHHELVRKRRPLSSIQQVTDLVREFDLMAGARQ
jgi:hypothetical protein